jgi:hypothetical protein
MPSDIPKGYFEIVLNHICLVLVAGYWVLDAHQFKNNFVSFVHPLRTFVVKGFQSGFFNYHTNNYYYLKISYLTVRIKIKSLNLSNIGTCNVHIIGIDIFLFFSFLTAKHAK